MLVIQPHWRLVNSRLNFQRVYSTLNSRTGKKLPVSVPSACDLNEAFADRGDLRIHPKVAKVQHNKITQFIHQADVHLDWSIYRYDTIPGEGKRLQIERDSKRARDELEELEQDEGDYRDGYEDEHEEESRSTNKDDQRGTDASKFASENSFHSVQQELDNNLPEFVLLGRCNAGKSSLINAILSPNKTGLAEYARVKQSAGYTPCMNFYNFGGLLRLVDTPGYGVKGQQWQGELVFQYLANRRVFRNAFLIVDSKVGLNQYDEMIINNLVELGVPFDFVFNKIDKIRPEERLQIITEVIEHPIIKSIPIMPRFFFVSANPQTRSDIQKRSGVTEILYAILEMCGVDFKGALTPRKFAKRTKEVQKRITHQNTMRHKRQIEKKQAQKAKTGAKKTTK